MALEEFDLKKIGVIAVAAIIVLGGAYFFLGFRGQPERPLDEAPIQVFEPLPLGVADPSLVPEPFISTGNLLLDCVERFYRREKSDYCSELSEVECKKEANDWFVYCASNYNVVEGVPPTNRELVGDQVSAFCGSI